MIYADALRFTADGQSSPRLFEESITVVELTLETSASALVTVKLYHSIGGRLYRQIGTMTINAANPTSDMHIERTWPPGLYYATVVGMDAGAKLYVSFSGE